MSVASVRAESGLLVLLCSFSAAIRCALSFDACIVFARRVELTTPSLLSVILVGIRSERRGGLCTGSFSISMSGAGLRIWGGSAGGSMGGTGALGVIGLGWLSYSRSCFG